MARLGKWIAFSSATTRAPTATEFPGTILRVMVITQRVGLALQIFQFSHDEFTLF